MRALTASVLGLAALLSGACGHEAHHGEEGGTYPVTVPLKTDTAITTQYVSQIRAIQHIEVRAMEEGYLDEVFVDEGQRVTAGQPLFQIMPALYQAELRAASAEVDFARIEYENTRSLADGRVVSPNELKLAQARLDKAEAELALARVHLGLTEIRAPFDGIMGRLEVRHGSLLEEGELMTTLSDNSEMWVYFNVSEAGYLDYQEHVADTDEPPAVQLMLANSRIFPHEGRVSTIEADFNNETGNIAFRATFPNPEGILRHGATGKVLMSAPLTGVLVIPQKATFDILDKKFVFVIDEHGIAHSREIHIAEELPHLYVVRDGLAEDEQILLEGLRKVRDGEEVHHRFEEPQAVIARLELPAE